MTLKDMKAYLTKNADPHGNLWCHCEGCVGTYTPYRVNTWGLRNTETNKEDGRDMVQQQVTNVLRHLQKAHGIPKEEVTEDVLPKGTPHFQMEELLTLRKKVETLERDVGGLEAIVLNLDSKRLRLSKRYERLDKDYERLDEQLEALYDDAANGKPFVSPNGPDEDELPGMSSLREVLHDREKWVSEQASRQRPAEETGEEGEEEKGDDSDVELTGVEYYPPPPASLDELEEEQQDEGSTALVEEQEEEEQQPPAPATQSPPPTPTTSKAPPTMPKAPPTTSPPPTPTTTQAPPAPPPQLELETTSHTPVSMDLTCRQPATTSCSFLNVLNVPTTSSVDMELTEPINATIHVRKRAREAEEEELKLPEEFQPLAVSTPNDPKEEGSLTATKTCKLGPGSAKRPAYDQLNSAPLRKQPRVTREEDDSILVLLSSEEQQENLVMAATPELSWRTLLWTPGAILPPRKRKAPQNIPHKPSLPGPSREPTSFTLPKMAPWPDHDPTKPPGQCPSCMLSRQVTEGVLTTGNIPSHLTGLPY